MAASDYDPVPLPQRPAPSAAESRQRAQDYYQLIRQRHTVRDFKADPVDRAIIEDCVRAAGTAPSGANHQPWHFVCISDPTVKRRIRIAAEAEEQAFYEGRAGDRWLDDLKSLGTDASKPFLEVAPWLIAVFAQPKSPNDAGIERKNYYVRESVGIATGFLINALHSAGLATLTHTPNPMKFLNEILGRPASDRAFVLLVVGHAADDATIPRSATIKKPLEAISTFI